MSYSPVITTSDPTGGQVNVPINKVLSLNFDTGLFTGSIVGSNFGLMHQLSKASVPVSVTYTSGAHNKISVIPNTLLYKNSTYRLRIVGSDLNAPAGYLKGSDGSAFTGTTNIIFITSDDIQVAEGSKTDAIEDLEGAIRLPSGIKYTQDSTFLLSDTIPSNHSWGFTGSTITLKFSKDVQNTSVAGNVNVGIRPFLDEDGWLANSGSSTNGYVFEWDRGAWTSEAGSFFGPPTWTIVTSGTTVTLTSSKEAFRNAIYEVTIAENLEDTLGNKLDNEYISTFTSLSYPSLLTPRSIRYEINTVFDLLNLDFVQQLLWKWSIEAFRLVGFNKSQLSSGGVYIRRFIRYGTIIDIMSDLYLSKSIYAGVTKTLGDFTVSYHPDAAKLGKEHILNRYISQFEGARRAIMYGAGSARIFIKGLESPLDRANFRTRLWKNPYVGSSDQASFSTYLPAANTYIEKQSRLPGNDDLWS